MRTIRGNLHELFCNTNIVACIAACSTRLEATRDATRGNSLDRALLCKGNSLLIIDFFVNNRDECSVLTIHKPLGFVYLRHSNHRLNLSTSREASRRYKGWPITVVMISSN